MDLDFTEEQDLLRQTVRSLCDDVAPLDVVRQMEDDAGGYPEDLWKQLAALDMVGLLLPEAHGGSGMSLIEGAVVYEELGRGVTPSPHFVSAIVAGGLLVRAGTPEQQAAWLPGIASGETIVTTAWLEPEGGYRPGGITVTATADGDGWTISGLKRHVPFAAAADAFVVVARTGPGDDGVALFLVPGDAEGVTLRQQMTIASDTQYEVTFDGVAVGADALVPGGWPAWEATLTEAIVLVAAQAIGGAQAALDMTVQYAKDRQQFDKPLGAFQAIAHYLADARTAVDGGRVLVYEAAWAAAEGKPDAAKLAQMAKLFACQTFRDVTAMGQQIFGGVGFTLEYDIQLYFRRAKALQLSWFDSRTLEAKIADAVLA